MFKMTYVNKQDLVDICKGKLDWKKCKDCDCNGLQYYDGSTGLGVSHSPSGINEEFLAYEECDTCGGIGYMFYYPE